jgi:hypothetical protein
MRSRWCREPSFRDVSLYVACDAGEVLVGRVQDVAREAPYVFGVVRDLPTSAQTEACAELHGGTHQIQKVRVFVRHGY